MKHSCHITSDKKLNEDDIQIIISKLSREFNFEYSSINSSKYDIVIISDFDDYGTLSDMKLFVRRFTSELKKLNHIISYQWYDNFKN